MTDHAAKLQEGALGITTCAMLVAALPSYAAPSIQGASGTFSQNSTVTISGSGFGTNALDMEWLGDSIETGTSGSDFSKTGWNNNWGFENAKYADDQRHSNGKSLKCVPLPATSWNCAFSYKLSNPVTAGQSLYLTWWVRKDNASNAGQWKMLRLSADETIVDGPQELVMFNWPGSQYQLVINPGESTDQSFWLPANVYPAGDNNWYRMELTVAASSTNQTNGTVTMTRYDGASANTTSVSIKSHVNAGDTYGYVVFQNYEGNGMDTSGLWFDDILIQIGVPARVELCDSQTWSSRAHCEIQVPISWSAASITISVQPGTFVSGQTAYLFVIDPTGTASGGTPITINSSSSNTGVAPAPPGNLWVMATN